MNIPDIIKIGGHYFEVKKTTSKYVSNTATCENFYNLIQINTDAAQSAQDEALLHEIVEAIDTANDFKLSHMIISTLAENLYQVLKDNKLNFGE